MELSRENNKTDGQGRGNTTKDLWVKIRRGREHSPVTATDKADPTWGHWPNLLSNEIKVVINKN